MIVTLHSPLTHSKCWTGKVTDLPDHAVEIDLSDAGETLGIPVLFLTPVAVSSLLTSSFDALLSPHSLSSGSSDLLRPLYFSLLFY